MPETMSKIKEKAATPDKFTEDEAPVETSRAEELAHSIIESARATGNEITYGEINVMLSDANPDKDLLEDIYDIVESKGINIVDTREPSSNELEGDIDLDDDDLLDLDIDLDDSKSGGEIGVVAVDVNVIDVLVDCQCLVVIFRHADDFSVEFQQVYILIGIDDNQPFCLFTICDVLNVAVVQMAYFVIGLYTLIVDIVSVKPI